MSTKRPYPARRVAGKRRKYASKRMTAKAGRRMNRQQELYCFQRGCSQPPDLIGNAIYAPFLGNLNFSLNQVINPTDFSNLFDRYRINYVTVKVRLAIDPGAQIPASARYPRIWWVHDFDDAVIPGSIAELREHANYREAALDPHKPVEMKIRPSTLSLIYRTAVASSYEPKWNTWVDMAQTDVPHYGIKFGIDDLTNTAYRVTFEQRLFFECKNVR